MGQAITRQEKFWEACGFGRPHIVKHMIQEGIDVNWKSYTHDCCPIHVASQGKPEIVKLLLEAKCNVHVIDILEKTALHHAAMKGHAQIMETLIKAGIDPDAQDKNGWTALHNACYWCYPEAVKVLIKHGCNVHITNKDNRTALHETARSKESDDVKLGEIAKCLIDAGSDINAKGCDLGEVDFTSLMFSAYHGHPEVVNRLLEAGCGVNACGSNGWTALHWAVDREQEEVVYILLDAGANPTKKGTRGELPSDRARNDDMKEILMNAANLFRELEKDKSPSSPSRLSRISYTSMTSLNHSPTKTGPHGLVEENQFSPPRSPAKHSDLSDLIDKINQKSNKIQGVSRHDKKDRKSGAMNSPDVDNPKDITKPIVEVSDKDELDDEKTESVKLNEDVNDHEDKIEGNCVPTKAEAEDDLEENKESDVSDEALLVNKLNAVEVNDAESMGVEEDTSASVNHQSSSNPSQPTDVAKDVEPEDLDDTLTGVEFDMTASADTEITATSVSADGQLAKKIQTTI